MPLDKAILLALLGSIVCVSAAVSADTKAAARILHFPAKFSLGRLYEINEKVDFALAADVRGRFIGTATGDVAVPGKAKILLDLDPKVGEQPQLMHGLAADTLYCLRVRYSDGNDDLMREIAKLSALHRIDLLECEATDAGVIALAALKNLEHLGIVTAQINGSCFEKFAGPTKLRYLNASGNKLAPLAMAHITRIQNLETINLSGCNIRDDGLKNLKDLKNLHGMNLTSNPQITAAGLQSLAACKGLHFLSLRHTAVKASDILKLRGLQLSWLEISEVSLTKPLESELARTFPVCTFALAKKEPDADNKMLFAPVTR